MNKESREIDRKTNNGCRHRWEPVWWKPPNVWLKRGCDSGPLMVDPKVAFVAQELESRKFYDAGYRRAHRCTMKCGLAYLSKSGAVVPVRDEGV